jgi:DNA modification methylase
MNYKIIQGDCIESLKTLDNESVNCCVTSPPYWGLRDYGTAEWKGGDPKCSHKRDSKHSDSCSTGQKNLEGAIGDGIYKTECPKCGATRKDSQLGLEETPEEYVANMVKVFSEVKRVLTKDGTLWLNLGDSYAGSGKGPAGNLKDKGERHLENVTKPYTDSVLKGKDLVGIPWRVAFALQADGWYLRQDIIWHKPNPMPESVADRCTKAHEYIFLLSKSSKYYYDHEAIMEEASYKDQPRGGSKNRYEQHEFGGDNKIYNTRNKRSVWTVNTRPYPEAHFATYPKKLIRPCIKAGCPQGGVVLDPFGGSGTTAEVANELQRDAILCELNPKYCELIEKRLSLTQMDMFPCS